MVGSSLFEVQPIGVQVIVSEGVVDDNSLCFVC